MTSRLARGCPVSKFAESEDTPEKQRPHSGTCAEVEAVLIETVKKLRAVEAESKRLERILERDHDENCKWRVAEIGKLHARVAELEARTGTWYSPEAFLSMKARAEEVESLNEHSRNQIYFLIDQKHKLEARVAELEVARDNWRTRYETLRAHRKA